MIDFSSAEQCKINLFKFMLAEFRLHNTDCHAHYRYGIRKVYGAVTVDIGKRQVLFGNVSQIKRVAHDCDCVRNGNSAVTVNIAHDTVAV